ncbi:MAG: hypothetical protein E7262_08735 [Lachnospiraceae bacterium]|nr:hypothetical protein [Lachnospiraceae bacterium]
MKRNKKVVISTLSMVTVLSFLVCVSTNSTEVYANQIDAPVAISTDAPSTDTTVSVDTTGAGTTQVQSSTRKAPVSIAVYSNVVTESADTYDYNSKPAETVAPSNTPIATTLPMCQTLTHITTAQPIDTLTAAPTSEPATTNTPAVAPQGTGSPDATPEPDMITYPPTVAPTYID